ncbi:MAG: hypothetical protein VX466_14445 [Myxococcota bacterium]|nr:hypothetical protein [Myxococcota bacterium]
MRLIRNCRLALAYLGLAALAGSGCTDLPTIVVVSPSHGAFTTAATVDVTGLAINLDPADAALTVNGMAVAVSGSGMFTTTISIDPAIVFNPIDLELTDTSNGFVVKSRITVISGDSIADGTYSQESIALRINDSGLNTLESIVADLVEFDPADLVPVGTVVLNECVVFDPFFGFCLGSAVVTIVNPPPTASSFGLAMDSMTNFVTGDVLVTDLDISLSIVGSGLAPSCPLDITAATTDILGDYELDPDAVDPNFVDVNQLPGVSVSFGNFNYQLFGICDVPIIGDIIQLFLPDIETLFAQGFLDFLQDPDGTGPLDAPIADAIEVALQGIDISGPIGQGLGVVIDTPIFDVPEDNNGLTVGTDTSVIASVGTGPGQCNAPASAPDLLASLHVTDPFPSFSPLTPGGIPYELGICISTSAFNQLLRAQIECGLLQLDLTEFDFGTGPIPLTTGTLSLLIPEFSIFPPTAPVLLRLRPTLAPVVTGNSGPGGELAELRIGHLILEIHDATPGVTQPLLALAIDFRAGLELLVDNASDQLAPTLTSIAPADVTISIIDNLVQTDEATLQAVLPVLLQVALPALGSSLGGFPVPSFLDLELDPVEISRNGNFMSIFADLRVPLLANGNMEDTLDGPADGLDWEGDLFTIVPAENGVNPINGIGMLRFDGTTPSGAAAGVDAEVSQLIDLSASAAQIATGLATLQTTTFFNRVDAGVNTDTEFQVIIEALDAGSLVIGSAAQLLLTDSDPTTWENQIAGLLLPAATASVRVTLLASENVLDDTVSPEFDGHYVDNARAHLLPPLPLANSDMEDLGDTNSDGNAWEVDPFTIVGAENGITPNGGSSMMRFDETGAVHWAASVEQAVDVTEYAGLIATGGASIHVRGVFNRVDLDPETDNLFGLRLTAQDAAGSTLDSSVTTLSSDGDVGTWEQLQTDLAMPVGTTQVLLRLGAFETVFADPVPPEFDGHYIDDVEIWISP